jgi:hypothetical protein
MISKKYKFIFVHITKCGGTSVETALKKYGGEYLWNRDEMKNENHQFIHKKHALAEKYSLTKYWKNSFKFTFVRNPWSREISAYFYRKRMTDFCGTFEEHIASKAFTARPLHHGNQYNWLISHNGKMELDFIARFENFQEDFNTICDKIGTPHQKLPHKNATKHKHYTEYYNDETRQIVAEKYAKDIEYFGYKFGE